ncbi:MAG: peptidase M6, partial [Candidatus Cloacimonetes bacterium]|nr:peptidase M6 [Candidatus Cloacimonadota bacterium]
MLNQPDGSKLDLYASGDEFYNWLHDKNGYTVKQNDAGWYVYLDKKNTDELVFTPYVVGRDNPATMGLVPWTNISSERMGEIRKQAVTRLRLSDSGRAPSTGTLNNLSIFIRFSDQSEYTQNISTYSSMFNGTTGNTMQSYFLEASYNALNIQTTFFPTPATTVISWQDSHPRGYYSPYSSSNLIGYNGDTERTNREFTLLENAVNGVRSQIPTSLNLDGDSDGLVDNVCFIIQGGTDGWA